MVTFEIPRVRGTLAGFLAIQRPDETVVVILLGSDPDVGPGIHVFSEDPPSTLRALYKRILHAGVESTDAARDWKFEDAERDFYLKAPGTQYNFDLDSFKVDVEARSHAGIRYYMVDITIKLPKVLTVADIVPVSGINSHKVRLKDPFRSQTA